MNAYGIAPCSRIHASAQHVSRPPENAIPTRSPTGSELEDRAAGSCIARRAFEVVRGTARASCAPRRPVAGGDEDRVLAGDRARDLRRARPCRSRRPAADASPARRVDRRAACRSAPSRRPSAAAPPRAARAGRGRRRPAARRRGAPSPFRTFTSPSWAMSRETVACTASIPSLAERLGDLRLRRELAAAGRAGGSPPAARTSSSPEHLPQDLDRRVRLLRRDRQRGREPERRLAGGADEQAALEGRLDDRPRRAGRARPRAAGRRRATPRSAARNRADTSRTWASSSSSTAATTAHAAAQATGLPPKVEAWSPGTKPVGASSDDEERADRQAVREPLRERDGVGPHALVLPGEERAGAADARSAPRRGRASRRARRRAPARARASRRASGRTPPSPCTGSSRIAAVSSSTASASVASVAKRHAGHERLERLALRGLARHRERAERAAVERALERDEAGLARSPCAPT